LGEAAVAEFEDLRVSFKEKLWGLRARLTGGPVIVTTVSAGGEGQRNGIQVLPER
jgi:hypothetical protein